MNIIGVILWALLMLGFIFGVFALVISAFISIV